MHAPLGQSRVLKRPSSSYNNRDEYRRIVSSELKCWKTQHLQTELLVCADSLQETTAYDAAVFLRGQMDEYIAQHPAFESSLAPVSALPGAPQVIGDMCEAATAAGVGPMAAVAGAFAAHVGNAVLRQSAQVIVENGGDVFMKMEKKATAAIFAGASPLSMKIGIAIDARQVPVAVCTSSGNIGHSKSFGNADAAVVVSHDACLADACATRLGNEVKCAEDIGAALALICGIEGVIGAVAVVGEVIGAMGGLQLENL